MTTSCRHPEGREGESFTEFCLLKKCKGGVWRTSLDPSLCCYEGQAFSPNTTVTTTMSEDNCVKASVNCMVDRGNAKQEQAEDIKMLLKKSIEKNCEETGPNMNIFDEPVKEHPEWLDDQVEGQFYGFVT